jgi:iron complex outermembrane receptor protein
MTRTFRHSPRPLWALLALAATPVLAQTETVFITGNPLGREPGAAATTTLSGAGLQLRRAATLGETLDGLPGIASSGFGPNAGRPVIRGLDGDRVRLLDNGGAAVDASNLSFDHAVALDPLVAERIEVLRGPAALLYGGNATGGVVNVIDNRIPRAAAPGFGGRAELRLGGASRERGGAAVLEGGAGGFAWHADAFGRRTEDQRTPRFTPIEDGAPLDPADRVRNSAAESRGGALGAGWVGAQGHAGLAVDTLRHDYGVTVEPDVTIRMERDRLAAAGEWRSTAGPVRGLDLRAGHTRYQHQEVEGDGAVGTTFKSEGDDLRLELRHAPLAGLEGVVGLQAESLRFSALGEEAFVPGTRTRSAAIFVLEEWRNGPLALSGGVRVEQVRVSSDGDEPGVSAPRFGQAQSRRFEPLLAAAGQPRPHRACTGLLRAVCQRRAPGDRGLRAR